MRTVGAGRYELEAEIAKGAIGVVWRALDTITGEPVAIKQLRPEAAAQTNLVECFLAEARILHDLDHPSVIGVRDLVVAESQYALVLDLVNGADLRRRLLAGGPLPPAVAVDAAAQIADALTHVHQRGVVHGDVKPANILVSVDGSPVRLADFGIARRVTWDGRRDAERATHATPEYVAPEVVSGEPSTPAADVYALGIVLYEALCGRSPYRGGSSGEVLRRHLTCVPVPPPGLPERIWPLITQCMTVDPDLRPSALLMARRMRAVLPGLRDLPALERATPDVVTWWPRGAAGPAPQPVAARVAASPAPFSVPLAALLARPSRRRPAVVPLAGLAAALAVALGMALLVLFVRPYVSAATHPTAVVSRNLTPGAVRTGVGSAGHRADRAGSDPATDEDPKGAAPVASGSPAGRDSAGRGAAREGGPGPRARPGGDASPIGVPGARPTRSTGHPDPTPASLRGMGGPMPTLPPGA